MESGIQSKILKYLNGLKGCAAENVSGNSQQKDRADINCCYLGVYYRIEVKSPTSNHDLTEGQLLDLQLWNRAGSVCVVVTSLEQVKNIVTGMTDGYPILSKTTLGDVNKWLKKMRKK